MQGQPRLELLILKDYFIGLFVPACVYLLLSVCLGYLSVPVVSVCFSVSWLHRSNDYGKEGNHIC